MLRYTRPKDATQLWEEIPKWVSLRDAKQSGRWIGFKVDPAGKVQGLLMEVEKNSS